MSDNGLSSLSCCVRLEQLRGELAEARREVAALQRALAFWHPGVPHHDACTDEQYARAADDAMLLAGATHEMEPGAATLGWVRWRLADSASGEQS